MLYECPHRPRPTSLFLAGALRVEHVLDDLGLFELEVLGRRDLDRLPRLRVASLTGLAIRNLELPKAEDRDFLAPLRRIRDSLEDALDEIPGESLRQLVLFS